MEEAGCGSFDIGRFKLVLEEIPNDPNAQYGKEVSNSEDKIHDLLAIPISGMEGQSAPEFGKIPDLGEICHSCNQFILYDEKICPHCNVNTAESEQRHLEELQKKKDTIEYLEGIFSKFSVNVTEDVNE